MQSIGFRLIEEATLLTLTSDTVDTSKIKGEFLNPDEVSSSIARKTGIESAEFITALRSVDGIVNVLLDATQNYNNPLTETRLFRWHNSLFKTGFSDGHSGKSARFIAVFFVGMYPFSYTFRRIFTKI